MSFGFICDVFQDVEYLTPRVSNSEIVHIERDFPLNLKEFCERNTWIVLIPSNSFSSIEEFHAMREFVEQHKDTYHIIYMTPTWGTVYNDFTYYSLWSQQYYYTKEDLRNLMNISILSEHTRYVTVILPEYHIEELLGIYLDRVYMILVSQLWCTHTYITQFWKNDTCFRTGILCEVGSYITQIIRDSNKTQLSLQLHIGKNCQHIIVNKDIK